MLAAACTRVTEFHWLFSAGSSALHVSLPAPVPIKAWIQMLTTLWTPGLADSHWKRSLSIQTQSFLGELRMRISQVAALKLQQVSQRPEAFLVVLQGTTVSGLLWTCGGGQRPGQCRRRRARAAAAALAKTLAPRARGEVSKVDTDGLRERLKGIPCCLRALPTGVQPLAYQETGLQP